MATHNPTKGDLWDRYIVLGLKIRHGWAAKKAIGHFVQEKDAILELLRPTFDVQELGALVRDLEMVHQRLWDAAGRQAQIKIEDAWEQSPFVLSLLAVELGELNRRRTLLKEEIEKVLHEWKGADKI